MTWKTDTGSVLRAALEQLPLTIYAADEAGDCTLSEGSGLAALRLSPGEMVGRNLLEEFPDTTEHGRLLRRVLAGELVARRVLLRPGLFIESRAMPLRNPAGEVIGLVGLTLDVTEQELIAQSRQRQVRNTSVLADLSRRLSELEADEGALVHVVAATLAEALQASVVLRLADLDSGAWEVRATAPAPAAAVAGDDGRDAGSHAPELVAEASLCVGDVEMGRVTAVRPPEAPFDAEDRELVEAVADRCSVAIGNARLLAEIRVGEERFARGFDNAPYGMALVGLDGRLLRTNAALAALSARTLEELAASNLRDLVHPDDVDRAFGELEALAEGRARVVHLVVRGLRGDARVVWSEITATAVPDGRGHVEHVHAQIVDITERRRAEREASGASPRSWTTPPTSWHSPISTGWSATSTPPGCGSSTRPAARCSDAR